MKKEYDFKYLPIIPDKARTTALFEEIAKTADIKYNTEYDAFFENLDDEEKAFLEYLGVDLSLCVPIIENNSDFVLYEFVSAVSGSIKDDTDSASFTVGRLETAVQKSSDYAQSAIVDLTISCKIKHIKKKSGIFEKIVYKKAKKQTEYKIAIQWQKKLYDDLKSKGVSFTPLSSDECHTYQQIWFEIFFRKKLGKKEDILSFFENENFEFETGKRAEMMFDRASKRNASVILPSYSVGAKIANTTAFKSQHVHEFSDIIVTAFDFSWTYCKKSDGKVYFYKPKGKKP